MTIRLSRQFVKQYAKLPANVRKKLDRQLQILASSFHHPSLNTKKMHGTRDIWEARVDYKHRFTFQAHNKLLILRRVGPHDVLQEP